MKRKLFIGSSTEGKKVAEFVKQILQEACGDWLEIECWSDGGVFELNKSALDTLIKASRRFDYGLLIATKDDKATIRGKKFQVPRDNVMFEMGMFLGSLGLNRAFLLVENDNKLPTDYNGVTITYFNKKKLEGIKKKCSNLISALELTRNTFNLKPMPSSSLAVGYFENFLLPAAKKFHEINDYYKIKVLIPKDIKFIEEAKVSYIRRNPSIEVSINENVSRPIIYRYINDTNQYWDIPTTLTTISSLIDLIYTNEEIGIPQLKKDWIQCELRDFAGALIALAEIYFTKGKITVEFMD